nr:PREDICTED: protein SSUH2 homolog [Apteryx mantelli mantelli]
MTEEAARTALLRFLNSKCCYGSKAAGELVIQELKQLTVYRYRLETFHESRLSEWAFEPFPLLGDWDCPVRTGMVPRARLQQECECHGCHGHGRSKCSVCHGAGWTRCVTCKGSRRSLKQQKRCQLCSGTGRKRCNTCSGRGSKTCAMCQGEKKLQHFKQLVITWRNNVFEFVSAHQLDLPGELLSRVNGENVFRDENVQVYPVADFPEPEICLASQRAVAEHSAAFAASSRILQQRQTIELIPVTEVRYRHAGKPYACYVYGLEEEVHAADYPARCSAPELPALRNLSRAKTKPSFPREQHFWENPRAAGGSLARRVRGWRLDRVCVPRTEEELSDTRGPFVPQSALCRGRGARALRDAAVAAGCFCMQQRAAGCKNSRRFARFGGARLRRRFLPKGKKWPHLTDYLRKDNLHVKKGQSRVLTEELQRTRIQKPKAFI